MQMFFLNLECVLQSCFSSDQIFSVTFANQSPYCALLIELVPLLILLPVVELVSLVNVTMALCLFMV